MESRLESSVVSLSLSSTTWISFSSPKVISILTVGFPLIITIVCEVNAEAVDSDCSILFCSIMLDRGWRFLE